MTLMAACCTFLVIASAGPDPELPIFGSFLQGLVAICTVACVAIVSRLLRNPAILVRRNGIPSLILYPGCIALHMYQD